MAIWQYDLFVVGDEVALPYLEEDGWVLPRLSAASTLTAQRALIGALGYPWLMMDDWVVFGSEVGTRVDLLFDGTDKVEIRIRLHASATEPELNAVCSFTSALNGQLFDPGTRMLLLPDCSALRFALSASRAAAFAIAPRAYFLGQEDI